MTEASAESSALAHARSVLGCGPEADRVEVEATHRRLVAAAHPDRHAGGDAAEVAAATSATQALNDARRLLVAHLDRAPPPRRRDGPVAHLRSRQHADLGPPPASPPGPEPDVPRRRGCLLPMAGAIGVVVACMVVLGLTSPGRSDSADRELLGPTAARYWQAEYEQDWATMWMLSDPALREVVAESDFVAHLRGCPRQVPPRSVYRMERRSDGLWEVEGRTAGSYQATGLQVFRRVATATTGGVTFGAVDEGSDLIEFLSTPLPQALAKPYCRRAS